MTRKALVRLAFLCGCFIVIVGALQPLAIAKKRPPAKPIDLNTATMNQLEELPGVGPVTAKAILDFRAKSGRFHRVEDLLAVHGISRGKFEKLRPYVTVTPASRRQQKPLPAHPH